MQVEKETHLVRAAIQCLQQLSPLLDVNDPVEQRERLQCMPAQKWSIG